MKNIRFKPKPLEIPDDNPFKEDLLSRKECAEILTEFVVSQTDPFVLAIDSPWGTGKTTFLTMWKKFLKTKSIPCLYFNAWENDFMESPLVSLIGEIGQTVHSLQSVDDGAHIKEAFEKTKRVGAAILKSALPAAIRIATSGIVDVKEISDLVGDLAKQQIDKYEAHKQSVDGFRRSLEEVVACLTGGTGDAVAKPLVFIIDELDRCRPTYAVELLERVKHLFNVKHLVFILAVHRSQLGECVKALYGSGIDADDYLRRFIDMEFILPRANRVKFIEGQFQRFGLHNALETRSHDYYNLHETLPKLFDLFDFSLRTQEQLFTQIAVVVRTTPLNCYLYANQLATLVCLRNVNRSLYSEYVSGESGPDEIMKFLREQDGGAEFVDSAIGCAVEANLVIGIKDYRLREKKFQYYEEIIKSPTADQREKDRAVMVRRAFDSPAGDNERLTDYLAPKIELAAHFQPIGNSA